MRNLFILLGILIGTGCAQAQKLNRVQGEILVQVENEKDIQQLISKVSPLRRSNATYTALAQAYWYKINFDFTEYNEYEALNKIRSNKRTISAQFNHFISFRQKNPNDTLYNKQWQWQNNGVNGKAKDIDSKAYLAWYKTTGGQTKKGREIVVAIIDDGTELNHIDLRQNMYVNHNEIPRNKIDDDENGYTDDYYGWNINSLNDSIDGGNHGVSVGGLVGAKGNNSTGITGVNWNIKMLNIKYDVSKGIQEADVISGYAYILQQRKLYNSTNGARGAFVVASNASWGIDDGKAADAPLWCAMYDSLGAAGILNITAADNRTTVNVDSTGDLPSVCPSNYLIAVTSIASDGKRAAAQGFKNIDLAAPGDFVFTTKANNRFGTEAGTSFAAPIVAGAIGLLYSNQCAVLDELSLSNPPAAALMVKNAILSSVDTSSILKTAVASGGYLNILKAMNTIQASCAACASGALASRIYIDSIVIDGMRFRSRDNKGYGDFTGVDSLTPSINRDGQALLKIFPRANDSINFYFIRIWMDRNQDNDFNDTAELVWSSGNQFRTGNIVSNIYLPITKIDSTGLTKLRISLKAVSSIIDTIKPSPCGFFNFGEVEDYDIKFLPKSFDCPDVLELESAMISEDGAKIFYQKIIPKLFYMIRYKAASAQKWDTLPTRDSMVSLSGLKKCTDYVVESKTLCDSDTSKFRTMLKFKTLGCSVPFKDQLVFNNALVYPNPFNSQFNVRFNIAEPLKQVKLRLITISGSLISEQYLGSLNSGQHEIRINATSQMSIGTYFVILQSEKGTMTRKLMKM